MIFYSGRHSVLREGLLVCAANPPSDGVLVALIAVDVYDRRVMC